MPAPIVLANLTPETKIVPNPPPGQPVIATAAPFRDGTRLTGPDTPEFNLASTSNSITAVITDGKGATSYEIRVDGGAAFSGLTASALTPEQTYSVEVRGLDENGPSAWSTPVNQTTTAVPVTPEGVIFQDNFDNQPDYDSGMYGTASAQVSPEYTVPNGWFAIRQDPSWAPSTGHPDRHESIEILASNSDKARGGTGKCYVSWRDSDIDPNFVNRFNSDSILAKKLDPGVSQVYVEFWIAFQPGWTPEGQSKLFRVSSWSESGEVFGYGGGRENGPTFFWDILNYGSNVRNFCAFRGGKHGDSYGLSQSQPPGFPRAQINGSSGDFTFDYTSNVIGTLPDQLNGGTISKTFGDEVDHEALFGPGGTFNKIAFWLKMNSAPGVVDGEFKMWMGDQPVLSTTQIMWVQDMDVGGVMPKWNIVALGGNDNFKSYSNEQRYEEWYAIDDVVIRADIPEELL